MHRTPVTITALVRQDHDPEEAHLTLLEHAPELDVAAALRAVAQDYARSTPTALQEVLRWTNGAFNWGDLVSVIPPAIFARHGLRIHKDVSQVITVEQNEQILVEWGIIDDI